MTPPEQGSAGPSGAAWRTEPPTDRVPQRVVSLAPALTESLFDLDLGGRLVAITSDCVQPAAGVQYLTRVGGPRHPDLDTIISLGSDLVLMQDEVNWRADAAKLEAAGIPVWVTGAHTVVEAINLLWTLMDVFDHAVMVPRVREIERAYDYTLAAAQAMDPVPTFLATGRGPWTTVNAAAYAHDVLRVCGAANVFAGHVVRAPVVTPDEVEAAQPELVLLADEPASVAETDVDAIRALDIPAARNGRVHRVPGSLLTWPGTRVAYALRDLPALIQGG